MRIEQNLGQHQFAFGGRVRFERFAYLSDRSPDQINFTNLATAFMTRRPEPTTARRPIPETRMPTSSWEQRQLFAD